MRLVLPYQEINDNINLTNTDIDPNDPGGELIALFDQEIASDLVNQLDPVTTVRDLQYHQHTLANSDDSPEGWAAIYAISSIAELIDELDISVSISAEENALFLTPNSAGPKIIPNDSQE